jgi:hypothetical protein
VLSVLGEQSSAAALQMAEGLLPKSRDEAALAIAAICRRLSATDPAAATAALERTRQAPLGDTAASRVRDAIAFIKQRSGYIRTWQVAGPFEHGGKGLRDVHDAVFPPERDASAADVVWRPLEAWSRDDPWIADLTKLDTGADRCVYVRALIESPTEQTARLEIGSDDALKVWLNGEPLLNKYVQRSVTPGDDKLDVRLRAGSNTILLKISQGGSAWGFICGVVGPDGAPLDGLEFRAQ